MSGALITSAPPRAGPRYGWEIPREVYEAVPAGTPAEAIVSKDGRYPYTLSTDS